MNPLRTLLDASTRALLVGVLNRTPDSFSDGGRFVDDAAAWARVDALVDEGADVVDLGAESTRPGAQAVSDDEQIARIGGAVAHVVRRGAIASIDTTSPAVAAFALREGASLVNSVSLEPAGALGALAARHGAMLALMHSRGAMTAMRGFSVYDDDAYGDVVADVARELLAAAEEAVRAGLPREHVILDPGLGFAKNARHSLTLLARQEELAALGYPLLVGPSRKSFLVAMLPEADRPKPEERLPATIAACLAARERGARLLRVHDVRAVRHALALADAARSPRREPVAHA